MAARTRLWTTLVLVAGLVVASPAPHQGALARPLDEVVESGTIVLAVYRDFPPFSYEEGGRLVGIDVDIAHDIASALGVKARMMVITPDETADDDLRNAVWKGHYLRHEVADLMLHVPVDRQFAMRNNQAVIFAPYLRKRIALAYDSEKLGSFTDLLDLRAEKIAVELDSLSDFFLTSAYGGQFRPNTVHFRTTSEAVSALRSGAVGVVMAPQSDVEGALGADDTHIRFRPVNMHGFGKSSWLIGLAAKEDSRDLAYEVGDIIDGMVRDGRMAEIFKRHRITYRAPGTD